MLDDVLRWLVQVTGLEPKLLTLTAILMVYSASVYLNAKKGVAGVAPAQPLELCDLADAVVRVESGVETVAKYLVNLEKYLDDVRLYGSFLTPYVPQAGIELDSPGIELGSPRRPPPEKYPSGPPRERPIPPEVHSGLDLEEEEPYFPVPPPITPKSKQSGFFLPLPQAEDLDAPAEPKPEPELPVQPPVQPDSEPKPEPELQPSPAMTETIKRMSRKGKAGRTLQ